MRCAFFLFDRDVTLTDLAKNPSRRESIMPSRFADALGVVAELGVMPDNRANKPLCR